MNDISPNPSRGVISEFNKRGRVVAPSVMSTLLLLAVTQSTPAAPIVGISGTMSNFDVFNETGSNVYGAEIDLEGVLPSQVMKTYPSHFTTMVATDYGTGTKLVFSGYTFNPPGTFIIPTAGLSTNGHYAVNLPGCEHFGFSVARQPTKTSFYWLNQLSQPVNPTPLSIPMPTWTYVPPVGNIAGFVKAVLPPVPAPPFQYPDAVWVKTYVSEINKQADLNELISYDPNNIDPAHPSIAPQRPSELETSWELLPGDAPLVEPDIQLADATQSILRRYEFFKYTGTYDEFHLPNSIFTGGDPLPGELGQFIAANMVAANLDVPEPSALGMLLIGGCGYLSQRRQKRTSVIIQTRFAKSLPPTY